MTGAPREAMNGTLRGTRIGLRGPLPSGGGMGEVGGPGKRLDVTSPSGLPDEDLPTAGVAQFESESRAIAPVAPTSCDSTTSGE